MDWVVCLFLSIGIFIYGIINAFFLSGAKNKGKRFLNPVNMLVISTFLASVVMLSLIHI